MLLSPCQKRSRAGILQFHPVYLRYLSEWQECANTGRSRQLIGRPNSTLSGHSNRRYLRVANAAIARESAACHARGVLSFLPRRLQSGDRASFRAIRYSEGPSRVVDPVTIPTVPNAPSGERRQVTVLFADMVGFTAISERLGEEGTFGLVQPIYELLEAAVREQGGSVRDFTGDGMMALFGAPDAQEDAPLRACRAGWAIHVRLGAAASAIETKHGVRPQMRVGVNSGPAVVTHIRADSGPVTALGDTVNLASRLQALAEPGTVYLSEATQRLVQGLVETTFVGVHAIKGKAEPQKVYRVDAIRQGAARFEAALARGLSAYIGRASEMDVLKRALDQARGELRVIDVVGEPGMGKSRLLYEFKQRIAKGQAFILTGSCSPDGQQTPFLPFIEVVRGAFQVRLGEAENEVVRKLEMGLTLLGLSSPETLGLLLNMLGLKPPEGTLTGLDGVLIGLRTRDLLQIFLEARCRLSPVILLIEDLHWIDSVSQEVLGKMVGGDTNLRLMILHTRRPEYAPKWVDLPILTELGLEPLLASDIRRLVQARLGVEVLPEALARLITEKSEGNPLFAEEIVSLLTERGVLRAGEGKVKFDADAVATALPVSVQSLLTARVDRLALRDRTLLQAAAVIGRRFDARLLAAVDGGGDVESRLAAMQALDLVHLDGKCGDHAFKHALVRDALYQSLLTGPRAALHLKIAEEVERRNANRLAEAAETLAHHYGQTDRFEKAFAYLALAGAKSLGLYSLEEAEKYLAAAIALVESNPECASDQQLAELLVDYTLLSNLSMRLNSTTKIVERFKFRLGRLGANPSCVFIQHHYVFALSSTARLREALTAQADLSAMAAKLDDARSKAYALVSAVQLSPYVRLHQADTFDSLSHEALAAASNLNDPYLQFLTRSAIAIEESFRGRLTNALKATEELVEVGRRANDPRSLGYGIAQRAMVTLVGGDYHAALNLGETCISLARTPYDRVMSNQARITALVLLKRPEGIPMLREFIEQCVANGWNTSLDLVEGVWGVALVMEGQIRKGIHSIEQTILRCEREGNRICADFNRILLCEIYLEIVTGKEKAPLLVLVRNAPTLIAVMITAQRRIHALIETVRQNPQFDPNGFNFARFETILGLLYKDNNKRALALQHLTEAKRIASQFGPTPMLAKIEAALAELA
jgi:class 3 adenylate cyclase